MMWPLAPLKHPLGSQLGARRSALIHQMKTTGCTGNHAYSNPSYSVCSVAVGATEHVRVMHPSLVAFAGVIAAL